MRVLAAAVLLCSSAVDFSIDDAVEFNKILAPDSVVLLAARLRRSRS